MLLIKLRRFLLVVLVGIMFYVVQNGCVENGKISSLLKDFMSNSTFEREYENIKYYKVSRETSDNRNTFNNGYLGSPGDILITKSSPFDVPIITPLCDFFFGGHSAIVSSSTKYNDGTYGKIGDIVLETVGNSGNLDGVREYRNFWGTLYDKDTIIGLRIKSFTTEDYYDVLNYSNTKLGLDYNYLFPIEFKDKFYCTDFVYRMFKIKNIKLNDGFITSTNDIILSSDVYIYFFQYYDKNGIKHVYY